MVGKREDTSSHLALLAAPRPGQSRSSGARFWRWPAVKARQAGSTVSNWAAEAAGLAAGVRVGAWLGVWVGVWTGAWLSVWANASVGPTPSATSSPNSRKLIDSDGRNGVNTQRESALRRYSRKPGSP